MTMNGIRALAKWASHVHQQVVGDTYKDSKIVAVN